MDIINNFMNYIESSYTGDSKIINHYLSVYEKSIKNLELSMISDNFHLMINLLKMNMQTNKVEPPRQTYIIAHFVISYPDIKFLEEKLSESKNENIDIVKNILIMKNRYINYYIRWLNENNISKEKEIPLFEHIYILHEIIINK